MGELPDCCVAPLGAVCELLTLPVMNSETINAPRIYPVSPVIAKETISEQSVCPRPVNDLLSVRPVSTYESEFACSVVTNTPDLELSVCPILTRESVFELSVLPVSVTKLSTPASVNALDCEISSSPTPINAFNHELSVFPVTVEGPNYGQSIHPASITELSVNPVPVNAPNCELSVGLNSALKLDSELYVFPVPTNKPKCELSACDPDFELFACSVSISESVCEMPARSVVIGETVD